MLSVWTVEQREFLLRSETDRFYALYILAATTGMRRSELCGLGWSSVDFATASVSLTATRVVVRGHAADSDGKSQDSVRVLALDPATLVGLQVHREHQAEERALFGIDYIPGDYVFRWEDGRPGHPDSIRQRFGRAVARSGLPAIRLHDMRHTYATAALRAGVPAKIVSASRPRLNHLHLGHLRARATGDGPPRDRPGEDVGKVG